MAATKLERPRNLTGARQNAFTLVELLVVISTIAVLASLLMPVLNKAMAGGRATESISNMRQIGAAIRLYLNDNDNSYPVLVGPPADPASSQEAYWVDQLATYLPPRKVNLRELGSRNEVFTCPVAKVHNNVSDFGANNTVVLPSANNEGLRLSSGLNATEIERPARTVLLAPS